MIQFLQDCSAGSIMEKYDWNRLRQLLGLTTTAAAASGPAAATTANIPAVRRTTGGPRGRGPVPRGTGTGLPNLAEAERGGIERPLCPVLVGRPPHPQKTDRYPWYLFLVQQALRDGDTGAALEYVNEGEQADREHNAGQRLNDFELRRGLVHVKRGEADQAHDVFQKLIERVPADLRYRVAATEAMLSLKQGPRALQFGEEGIARARQQQNRDAEQQLLELTAAARKLG